MTKQSQEHSRDGNESETGEQPFERVGTWLQANDFAYSEHPEGHYFSLRYTGTAGDWRVIIDVSADNQDPQLLIFSYYSIRVPESRRPVVAELMARINNSVWLGCFAMDWSDGEVSIRTSMPIADGVFTDQQLERLFYANIGLADRHLAGVCGVSFGNITPAVALEVGQTPPKEMLQ